MSKILATVLDLTGSQPQNTAGRDAAPAHARIRVCLLSLSRNTWKWGGGWTAAITLATRATPDRIIAAFLLRRHTNRPEASRTRTARACCAPQHRESQQRVWRGQQRDHSRTNGSAAAAPCGWVMIDSLLDYSEALVMNSLRVLVLFRLVWKGLSVSELYWFGGAPVPNVQLV